MDLRDFRLNPWENQGKTRRTFYFFRFFKVFQAQILRTYPRRYSASFRSSLELWKPKIDRFRNSFSFFRFFYHQNVKFNFFLLFCKEQALKPCSNSRSRDSAQVRQIESSVRPNLTDLVTKHGFTPKV